MYALDPGTGTVHWRYDAAGPVQTPPLVSGDLLMAGAADGYAYVLDKRSGQLRSKLAAGGPVTREVAVDAGWVYARQGNSTLVGIPR